MYGVERRFRRRLVCRHFLLTVLVTAAGVHESAVGAHLLDHLAAHHPTLSKAWAGNGDKNKAIERAATRAFDLDIGQRNPNTPGRSAEQKASIM